MSTLTSLIVRTCAEETKPSEWLNYQNLFDDIPKEVR
jgi:hypothetical protein